MGDYKWKISDLTPFGSNIGLIMYSCSDGAETKVMLVHNEHVVEEQPACGETLCSVSDFKAYYQHIVDFDWDTECPMPEPENVTSTTGAGDNNTDVVNIINIIDIVTGNGSTETNSEDNHHHHHEDTSDEDDSDEDDSDEDDSNEDHSDEEDSDEDDSSEEEKDK